MNRGSKSDAAVAKDLKADANNKTVTVVGAGVAGLWQALALAKAGWRVKVLEASATPFLDSASRWAGAMIAPECEAESAPALVRDLGRTSLALWQSEFPGEVIANGTLVLAAARDQAELLRFARATEGHVKISDDDLGKLEPDLAGRFGGALFFASEAHMDATAALAKLMSACVREGVDVAMGVRWNGEPHGLTIDCRGYGARAELTQLRGVRGERIIIRSQEIKLSRPVRLLHPRQPIYVVPQGDGRFVIGATVIEREDQGEMTVRSALELLGSAYALHPAFAEAAILDMGAGVRPAFPDNVPRIVVEAGGDIIRVNGAYRHGFLLAPVLAQAVVSYLADGIRAEGLFEVA